MIISLWSCHNVLKITYIVSSLQTSSWLNIPIEKRSNTVVSLDIPTKEVSILTHVMNVQVWDYSDDDPITTSGVDSNLNRREFDVVTQIMDLDLSKGSDKDQSQFSVGPSWFFVLWSVVWRKRERLRGIYLTDLDKWLKSVVCVCPPLSQEVGN